MKKIVCMLCMIGIVLVLSLSVPVLAANPPSISSISPTYGYNGASLKGVVITGTGFNLTSSLGKVRLKMSGETNITATVTSYSSTSLTCTFPITGAEAGDWDVVVVNRDLKEDVLSDAFTIKNAINLTSVSPTRAQTDNDVVTVTVVGTGLSDIDNLYLYNQDYDNITAEITSQTSTRVIGKFDLSDTDIDHYEICVEDSLGTIKCGLDFEILTDEGGSIEVTSSPSSAKVYLDSAYEGITPLTVENVSPGYHTIVISKTGYADWSERITVKNGITTSVNANLDATQTAVATSQPTVTPTVTVTKTSTIKVPTPWPTTTTQAAPLGTPVVLGAIALGFVVLFKKY
jgi:hypothetical protein